MTTQTALVSFSTTSPEGVTLARNGGTNFNDLLGRVKADSFYSQFLRTLSHICNSAEIPNSVEGARMADLASSSIISELPPKGKPAFINPGFELMDYLVDGDTVRINFGNIHHAVLSDSPFETRRYRTDKPEVMAKMMQMNPFIEFDDDETYMDVSVSAGSQEDIILSLCSLTPYEVTLGVTEEQLEHLVGKKLTQVMLSSLDSLPFLSATTISVDLGKPMTAAQLKMKTEIKEMQEEKRRHLIQMFDRNKF